MPLVKAQIDKLLDDPNSKTKAFATAIIGNTFAVHGIRIVESKNGTFMAMPSRTFQSKNGDTRYADYFHAISTEGFNALRAAVNAAYDKALEQAQNSDIEIIDEPEDEPIQTM